MQELMLPLQCQIMPVIRFPSAYSQIDLPV